MIKKEDFYIKAWGTNNKYRDIYYKFGFFGKFDYRDAKALVSYHARRTDYNKIWTFSDKSIGGYTIYTSQSKWTNKLFNQFLDQIIPTKRIYRDIFDRIFE